MNSRDESRKRSAEREMKGIWESYEWLYKEKLIQLDNMTRNMIREMSLFSVPPDMREEFVRQQFKRIWLEIAKEQEVTVGRKHLGKRGA